MKIYSFEALFFDGDCVYKDLRPSGYSNWNSQSETQIATGQALTMKWADDSKNKTIADFILFPMFGLASTLEVIKLFAPYAESAEIVRLRVDGETREYGFIDPHNFSETDANLDHLFLMFKTHKKVLVSEKFKEKWELKGLTGAVFTSVTEFADDRFKIVND